MLDSIYARCALSSVAILIAGSCERGAADPPPLPVYHLSEELRIGARDAPDYSLTEVQGLAVDSRGHIFVLQHQEQRIRQYDADGRFVREIGRRGQGPGEFTNPMFFGIQQDTVWVYDYGSSRIHFVAAGGGPTRSVPIPMLVEPGTLGLRPHHRLADGNLVGYVHATARVAATGPTIPILLLDPRGESLDTLVRISRRNRVLVLRNAQNPSSNEIVANQPFSDTPIMVAAPDGRRIFVVERWAARDEEAEFAVTSIAPNGDTLWTRRYPFHARRTPETRVDSLVHLWVGVTVPRMWPNPRQAESGVRALLFLPAFLPTITAAVATSNGGIWLRREDHVSGTKSRWTVLDSDGVPAFTVEAPQLLRLFHADNDHAWGVIQDEDAVPYVVRFALRPGPS